MVIGPKNPRFLRTTGLLRPMHRLGKRFMSSQRALFGADPSVQIKLSEVISALSYALDITEGQPKGHAARSCMLGMRLGKELRLGAAESSALFYALLLKDLGCSSNAGRMCYLFGADDRSVKRNVKTVD